MVKIELNYTTKIKTSNSFIYYDLLVASSNNYYYKKKRNDNINNDDEEENEEEKGRPRCVVVFTLVVIAYTFTMHYSTQERSRREALNK